MTAEQYHILKVPRCSNRNTEIVCIYFTSVASIVIINRNYMKKIAESILICDQLKFYRRTVSPPLGERNVMSHQTIVVFNNGESKHINHGDC